MPKNKRETTLAERRARRERKAKYIMVFVNGKQKRVPRMQQIDRMDVDEFIARNADPIWLHQYGMWEQLTFDDEDWGLVLTESKTASQRCS